MNNKVCKEYIREIKTIFPVKSKQEREYIKNLSNDIAEVRLMLFRNIFQQRGFPMLSRK